MTEFVDAPRPATAFDHDSTLVVAMELSGKSWQLGAAVPGVSRRPKRGLKPATRPSCWHLRNYGADTMACTE